VNSSHLDVNSCTMFLSPVCVDEVLSALARLKGSRSMDFYGMSNTFIKSIAAHIVQPLTYVANLCFVDGYFPEALKHCVVVPVYKGSGSKNDPNRYRPATLVPILSKIFESLYHRRLLNFLKANQTIVSNQYGFLKGVGTADLLANMMRCVNSKLNNNEFVNVVTTDLSKAFDTINHAALFAKLEAYGIRGKALDYCKSFLTHRYQCVKWGNNLSEEQLVEHGVPQGSQIGPILFLIFVNDLNKCIPQRLTNNVNLYQFADDSPFVVGAGNRELLIAGTESMLSTMAQWFGDNYMTMNEKKSKVMMVSLAGPPHGGGLPDPKTRARFGRGLML